VLFSNMKPARSFVFTTRCVESTRDDIEVLEENRRQITLKTFLKYLADGEADHLFHRLGYAVGREKGLRISNDRYVEFYKGIFRGKPCVELLWSEIDYIFTAR